MDQIESSPRFWNLVGGSEYASLSMLNEKSFNKIRESIKPYLPKLQANELALDLGSGRNTPYFLSATDYQRHIANFVSLDFAYKMLAPNPVVNKVLADGINAPFVKSTYSFITSFFLIRYVNYPLLFQEISRLAKPRARLLLVDFNSSPNMGLKTNNFKTEVIMEQLSAEFDQLEAKKILPAKIIKSETFFVPDQERGPCYLITGLKK